jgi:hypothetical protein
MPSGRDSFRRNRVAPFVLFYFTTDRHVPPTLPLYMRTSELVFASGIVRNFRVHLKEFRDDTRFLRGA